MKRHGVLGVLILLVLLVPIARFWFTRADTRYSSKQLLKSGQGNMKRCQGRVLVVTVVTCVLGMLAFGTGCEVKLHVLDGDSPGAKHETVSLWEPTYGLTPRPGSQRAVLDGGEPERRSRTPVEVGDLSVLAKTSASPGTVSVAQSSRVSAKVRDDSTEELFRPSTILVFFLTLLALIGLRRNSTDS